MASPQLLATWELVGFSMRDGGVAGAFANIGSLPPQELIGAVIPDFFGFARPGDVTQTYYHRGDGYWGSGENHWEMAFYLGLPAVVLAALGARRRPAWTALGGLSLLLMLGGATPAWPLMRLLPGLSGFRFPVRFALVLTIAVAVLAAHGLDRLSAATEIERRRWSRRVLALAGLALAGLLALGGGLRLAEVPLRGALTARYAHRPPPPAPPDDLPPLLRASLPDPEPIAPEEIPARVDRIVTSLLASTSPLGLRLWWPVLGLALVGMALRVSGQRGAWLLGGLLFVDLWRFGAGYQVRVDPALVEAESPLLETIRATPGRWRATVVDRRQDPALDTALMSASIGLMHGLRDVILTSPLLLVRNEALLGELGLDVGDRGAVKVERLARHPSLVDLLGVRWLLSVHDLTGAGYRRVADTQDLTVGLFENPDAIEGALIVDCVRLTDDPWSTLLDIDPRREAVVETPVDVPDCEVLLTESAVTMESAGRVEIVSETPTSLTLAVQADRPGLVVQTDSWYPGWTASLDGARVPLVVADLVFRGVAVPAGSHELVLRYEPPAITAALRAAVGCLLILPVWGLARVFVGSAGRTRAAKTASERSSAG